MTNNEIKELNRLLLLVRAVRARK